MAVVPKHPPFDLLLATGEPVAAARPEVDPSTVREIAEEAATLRHDGLVLDGVARHLLASRSFPLGQWLAAEEPVPGALQQAVRAVGAGRLTVPDPPPSPGPLDTAPF